MYIYTHIHVRYIHIQYNGYLWTNIEIICHQMKKNLTWTAEALKISQKPWQNYGTTIRLPTWIFAAFFFLRIVAVISFGILAIAMPFMTVLPTVETRTFFPRKKGGAFFQQSSSVKMPLANLTVSCLVVPSSLTASREGSFFTLPKCFVS